MELCLGSFPYGRWNTIFEQLNAVVNGPPPRLPSGNRFSTELQVFTEAWWAWAGGWMDGLVVGERMECCIWICSEHIYVVFFLLCYYCCWFLFVCFVIVVFQQSSESWHRSAKLWRTASKRGRDLSYVAPSSMYVKSSLLYLVLKVKILGLICEPHPLTLPSHRF